jgi:hypothetical protein
MKIEEQQWTASPATATGCATTKPFYDSYTGLFSYRRQEIDLQVALEPLIRQMRYYDELRLKLERFGGHVEDLKKISAALSKKLCVRGRFGESIHLSLSEPVALRKTMQDVGSFDLHLEIRRLDTGMPVYYLCRVRRDVWSAYSLIVEDLYRSPGYPVVDSRFVKLMDFGHEIYHIRLSPFRKGIMKLSLNTGDDPPDAIDSFLYKLGRHIFRAAWHEDQRPAVMAARHFDMPHFRHAIELLYVCLSGDLCEIRNILHPMVLRFFEVVYPQPALLALLNRLPRLEGEAINEQPRKALRLYSMLSCAFSRFLKLELQWGYLRVRVPLYKLLFGNFSRLPLVGRQMKNNELVTQAVAVLENESRSIISEIVCTDREPETHQGC